MENFLKNLTSPYWWVSIVVVGIAINLISIYLHKKLDSHLSNASSWWRKRSEQQKAKDLQEIDRLKNNPQAQILMSCLEMRYMMQHIAWMLSSGFLVGLVGFSFVIETTEVSKSPEFTSIRTISIVRVVTMIFAIISLLVARIERQSANKARYLLIIATKSTSSE